MKGTSRFVALAAIGTVLALGGCGGSASTADTEATSSGEAGSGTNTSTMSDGASPTWNGECPFTAEQASEAVGVDVVPYERPAEAATRVSSVCVFVGDPDEPGYEGDFSKAEVTFSAFEEPGGAPGPDGGTETVEKSCSFLEGIEGVSVTSRPEWGDGACQTSTEVEDISGSYFIMGDLGASVDVSADSVSRAEEGLEYLMGIIFE